MMLGIKRHSVSNIILIDTMVAAGILASTKTGSHVEIQKKEWQRAINSLLDHLYRGDHYLRIPTPACYELMCWNSGWYQEIRNTDLPLFQYKNYSISGTIIDLGAQFANSTNSYTDDEGKLKVKTLDPLIAAYCLNLQLPLLTTNECDYPEKYFTESGVEILKLPGKNGKIIRKALYLLIPKVLNKD